ncbi:hypothetical protein YC2023_013568 [Brassica napus]
MEAVRKMKGGKCEEAVQLLRDANMRYKNEPEAAFNIDIISSLHLEALRISNTPYTRIHSLLEQQEDYACFLSCCWFESQNVYDHGDRKTEDPNVHQHFPGEKED